MVSPRGLAPTDWLKVLWRRKWIIVASVMIGLAGAWAFCEMATKRYKSSTLIIVESQKVPENYVKGVVSGSLQERLGTIRQMILSRSLLTNVIEDTGLQGKNAGGEPSDALIEDLRKNIEIMTTRDEAFSIAYYSSDPFMAMNVTRKLAEHFIVGNLRNRETLVERASEFILGELNLAKQELEAKEKAISEFKLRYVGELPGQVDANLRSLDRLQAELSSRYESVQRLTERLVGIEKEIKEYQVTGTLSSPSSSVVLERRSAAKDARTAELEQRLATLSATYKDTYPDIHLLKEEIARLKALPREPQDVVSPGVSVPEPPKTVDPLLRDLSRQQREVKAEIESSKDLIAKLSAQKKVYESRVENSPTREQQMASLSRDYENMQRNYQALLEKRLNARIAENLERTQQGEQFRVIDPANLPVDPIWPDRYRIMLAGLALGCGVGVGLVIALDRARPVFQDAAEIERELGIPVLGTILDFSLAYSSGSRGRALPELGAVRPATAQPSLPAPAAGDDVAPRSSSSWLSLKRWTQVRKVGGGKFTSSPQSVPELNLVAKWRPWSVVSEQYRVAATRLVLMGSTKKSTTVLVTSSLQGEGKTSSAVNLAYVLANDLGKSTLLIDCDVKHARVAPYTGISVDLGLADVLHEGMPIQACIQRYGNLPLWILPSGQSGRRPIQLHHIQKLDGLLAAVRDQYDFIILDSPPIYPLAEVNVLANMVDVVTIVVRASETSRDVVKQALAGVKLKAARTILLTGVMSSEAPPYILKGYYLHESADVHS